MVDLDRRRFEARLDRLVADNRFTIAVTFPAIGAVMLLASAEGWFPGILEFNPYLVLFGTAVMRLPLIAGIAPLVDRRAGLAIVALTLYTYGIEFTGVLTGLPYGHFEYAIDLGPMLLDTVPAALPIFFFPLVLNAYLLCLLLLGDRASLTRVRLPAVIATVLAMDLVLDPGAVGLGFWEYAPPLSGDGLWAGATAAQFYGVPLSNYLGWVLSASVAVLAFDLGFQRAGLLDRLERTGFMLDDLVSFVILWGAINAWYGNWLAVAVAGLFGVGLLATDRFDFAVRETVPLVRSRQ
ncbi:bisanhydrobacterioruberin hydratase [Halorhabdus sp. CUG00001]|uniref:bisanhydrobacterioruberin hydratase n=1 Tax=Halorhabdus sp. CUG00001 TaxID=2600297 RepID=UPI00131CCFAE|nr:bisanhydrobacterioruberin hydratase [Halorhabdus sp. CUG00001]